MTTHRTGNTSMTYQMGGTILSMTVKEIDLGVTMNANMKVSEHRRAARRGQGGRLTTLNVRPWAVTTLTLGHVSNFLSSNISSKQTRQYRKSTKEATSGKPCERKGETNNCSKKTVSRPNNASSDRRSLQKFHKKQNVCSKFHHMWVRQSRHDITGHILSLGFKSVALCK